MSLKLNDEQRKLVEQNHNLIYSAMTKCGIRRQDFDDYYGFAAIGLNLVNTDQPNDTS